MPDKEYLGDGVYVTVIHGMLYLSTEDGISVTNRIWLEPAVLESFISYLKRIGELPND